MAQLFFLQGCRGLPLPLKGDPFGFNYNGKDYYYIRNGQNDIIGIVDTNGAQVVSYTYDTWGKLLGIYSKDANGNFTIDRTNDTSFIGYINPYRCRGYSYDLSTGLFYVGSRYYDPNTGRWLNADEYVSTGTGLLGYKCLLIVITIQSTDLILLALIG